MNLLNLSFTPILLEATKVSKVVDEKIVETTTTTSSSSGGIDWTDIVQYGFLSLLFFSLGLLAAWLLLSRGNSARRLRSAREENLRMTTRLGEMVEDQSVLIGSLQNKYNVEQKRWNLQLANRDTKLDELNNRLSQFDEDSPTVQANIAAKDEQIRKINLQLQERTREIERIKKTTAQNDGALTGRVTQLENLLKQRDQEIRNVRAEQRSQNEEWDRLIKLKEEEIEELRNRQPEVVEVNNEGPRISELEALIGRRDSELNQLRGEMAQQEKDINELLSGRDDELNRLRAERVNYDGVESRINELEQIIQNKNSEIDSLKNAQRGRVEELEDMLGERESMIVALQDDLAAKEGLRDQHGRVRDLEDQIMRLKRELADRTDLRGEIQHLQNQLRGRDSEFDGLRNQLETSRRDRDARIQELNDMLRDRDDELNRLRAEAANTEVFDKRIGELEWQLNERNEELDGRNKRIEEVERLLWEKSEQFENLQNEKQGNVQELEWKIGEKDSELVSIRQEKDSLAGKLRELEWLLGEKDGELEFLRHEKNELDSKVSVSDGLTSRVEQLESSLRERDGEVERWLTENEELKSQLRSRDSEIESLRRTANSNENIRSRIEELEWLLGERDGELERLRSERDSELERLRGNEVELNRLRTERTSADELQFRIRDLERAVGQKDNEISSLRGDVERFRLSRNNEVNLETRIRDLEFQLNERERELHLLRMSQQQTRTDYSNNNSSNLTKLSSIERASNQDLHSRIRELERLLDQSGSATSSLPSRSSSNYRPPVSQPSENAEYRLTMDDGTVVYVRGDETIEYEGRMRTASELFESLEDDKRGY